jgi:CheY-like chemotaxis protein
VIDDNVDAAESIALLLESDGHVARVAHDGPAALIAARTLSPELVLLDLGLPGMNGYQVAELLRADPACAQSLFVALTGFGREEDRRRSTDAGFRAHLTKPVEYAELGALVRDLPA